MSYLPALPIDMAKLSGWSAILHCGPDDAKASHRPLRDQANGCGKLGVENFWGAGFVSGPGIFSSLIRYYDSRASSARIPHIRRINETYIFLGVNLVIAALFVTGNGPVYYAIGALSILEGTIFAFLDIRHRKRKTAGSVHEEMLSMIS